MRSLRWQFPGQLGIQVDTQAGLGVPPVLDLSQLRFVLIRDDKNTAFLLNQVRQEADGLLGT